jgi:hypothetical protein
MRIPPKIARILGFLRRDPLFWGRSPHFNIFDRTRTKRRNCQDGGLCNRVGGHGWCLCCCCAGSHSCLGESMVFTSNWRRRLQKFSNLRSFYFRQGPLSKRSGWSDAGCLIENNRTLTKAVRGRRGKLTRIIRQRLRRDCGLCGMLEFQG